MTLRDTFIGRWVRMHPTLHRWVHATWCQVVGSLDTRRVATTGGTTTSIVGGNTTTSPTAAQQMFMGTQQQALANSTGSFVPTVGGGVGQLQSNGTVTPITPQLTAGTAASIQQAQLGAVKSRKQGVSGAVY